MLYTDDSEDKKVRFLSREPIKIKGLYNESFFRYAERKYDIAWARRVSDLSKISDHYMSYGNESYLSCSYANVCTVVDVGPPGNRSKISA